MKRQLQIFMLLVLAVSLVLAGCSSSNNGNSNAVSTNTPAEDKGNQAETNDTEKEKEKDPLEMSWYVVYDWVTITPWGEDLSTEWIKNDQNVQINWVAANGAADQNLNNMIVSGELPDVITMDRGAKIEQLVQAGMLVALDEYIDKYPNLKKWLGDDAINMLRSSDGKLYQFPNWYTGSGELGGNAGWMINTKIYKELGSPKLETFTDLENYLTLAKEKYPDITPLDVQEQFRGFPVIYSGFGENKPFFNVDKTYFYQDGDQLLPVFDDPALKEALLYTSRLFRNKLITQDAFTQTYDQYMEKVNSGKAAVVVSVDAFNQGHEGSLPGKGVDEEPLYKAIWTIHKEGLDASKIKPDPKYRTGWNSTLITKKAKDPEAIFAFMDWMTSPDGQRIRFDGPPGVLWDEIGDDGVVIKTNKYTDAELEKMVLTSDFNWVANGNYFGEIDYKTKMKEDEGVRPWTAWSTLAQKEVYGQTSFDATEFENIYPAPDSDEGIADQKIAEIMQELLAKAVFAKDDSEVEKLLAAAKADAEKAGIAKVVAFKEARWKENLVKLNK
ncbi:extracellular solute-binding protein [Paenibacillus sp. LHD-117]|uniref:extracellular solute-binding protein n=1 Tax=Paenibacillus sp. LHD-117 TaxID=3071412 RepID=UPI0027E06030|nr:extracellular solute-binding protein [Paenibacillus sp. LHD-117]MDQ6422964.1 extracellular solute-binding protein [Paenibacillus sp. LHD-117]